MSERFFREPLSRVERGRQELLQVEEQVVVHHVEEGEEALVLHP